MLQGRASLPAAAPLGAGRLSRLGGSIALDGRVSWAPHLPGRFQPVSCYLIAEPDRTILIDTGIPAHREAVVSQLAAAREPGKPLTLFLTRTELDCSGNVRAIHASAGIDEIIA